MLGVPVADRDRFTVWTSKATLGLASQFLPPETLVEVQTAGMSLATYFDELITARRGHRSEDLLSALIRAEEAGDRLTPPELLSQAIGLLIAGFETTIGLIGNGIRALIRHPAELARLRARTELAASAVDECLRYDGPIILTPRVLHADVECGGRILPRDAKVWGMLAAADRDPEVFPDPDRFDIERLPEAHERRPRGAAPEPGLRVGCAPEIEPRQRRPREHGGHVQVGDREGVSQQVLLADEPAVQDAERRLEPLRGIVGLLRVALIGGVEHAMEQSGQHRLLQLGHRPQAPLEGTPLVLDPLGPQALVVLARQVEVDGHRLPERQVAVLQHRDVAVRVDLQK